MMIQKSMLPHKNLKFPELNMPGKLLCTEFMVSLQMVLSIWFMLMYWNVTLAVEFSKRLFQLW